MDMALESPSCASASVSCASCKMEAFGSLGVADTEKHCMASAEAAALCHSSAESRQT